MPKSLSERKTSGQKDKGKLEVTGIGSKSLSGICQRANELDSAKRDYPLPDIVLLDDSFPVRVVAAVGACHHPSSSRSHFATFSGNLLSKSQQSENLATDDEQDREEGKFGSKSRERAKEKKNLTSCQQLRKSRKQRNISKNPFLFVVTFCFR